MVTVYTKDYCPYCKQAKALLDSLNVKYEEVDVTDDFDKLTEISEKSGMQTVPQIFVGEKCLGGFSDIDALNKDGKLMDAING